jgi:hypothetical protein
VRRPTEGHHSFAVTAKAPAVGDHSTMVGRRHHGLYVRLVLDTRRGHLTAYLDGRVVKRWPCPLLNK